MNYIRLILIILLVISFILSIIHIINPKKYIPSPSPSPLTKLQNLYNNTNYDQNGIPEGGFLISMLNTYTICPNYKTAGPCDKICNTMLDIGNIDNLMSIVSESGAGTNCLSLDTTYFRKDLSPYAFGPLNSGTKPSQDFVIGIIIDVKKIWQYIACMYTLDSGSISRYNNDTISTGSFTECDTYDNDCWFNYLKSNQSKYLGFAGCGKFDSYENNRGLKDAAFNFL